MKFLVSAVSNGGFVGIGPIEFSSLTALKKELDDIVKRFSEYYPTAVASILIQATPESPVPLKEGQKK